MKKIIFLLLCLSLAQTIKAQRLEIFGGVFYNSYYDNMIGKEEETGSGYRSSLSGGVGPSIGVAIEDIKIIDPIRLRLSVKLDQCNGGVYLENSGNAASYRYEAATRKNILALGIYPFNFLVKKKVRISLGAEVNVLLNGSANGLVLFNPVILVQMESVFLQIISIQK